jgi:hypothetical protein
MLTIRVSGVESFDEKSQEFTTQGGTILELEHSLVSLSKWESIYEKPFLGKDPKTAEEVFAYVKCMTLTPEVPKEIFQQLSDEDFKAVHEYIDAKMTATWFSDPPGAPKTSREVVTAELIYYWMTVFNIPFECEHWHLNRLFTLIRICNIKAAKPKKMSRTETAARQRELNAQRKAQLGTRG